MIAPGAALHRTVAFAVRVSERMGGREREGAREGEGRREGGKEGGRDGEERD